MNKQQHTSGDAAAQRRLPDDQVDLFLFDLKNEATEHGFRTGESWHLQLVTEMELVDLKKYHHPVVSLRLHPDYLLKAYQQLRDRLQLPQTAADEALTVGELQENEKTRLAAYPARVDRK